MNSGITKAQIEALKSEAAAAGDDMQHAICLIALEGPVDSFEERFGGGGFRLTKRQRSKLESMLQADARAICAEVIAYASAREC